MRCADKRTQTNGVELLTPRTDRDGCLRMRWTSGCSKVDGAAGDDGGGLFGLRGEEMVNEFGAYLKGLECSESHGRSAPKQEAKMKPRNNKIGQGKNMLRKSDAEKSKMRSKSTKKPLRDVSNAKPVTKPANNTKKNDGGQMGDKSIDHLITHVALDVIKKNDVSAAIFGPGWVHETKQPPDFQTAQNRWWGLIEKSWGTVQKQPKELPFYSNFDQGHGNHISVDGKQVLSTPWNNISSQSIQPFIEFNDSNTRPIQVSIGVKEASYSGGGNITFRGTLDSASEFTARLFQGELLLGNFPIHFTYSVKSSGNSLLGLALESSNACNENSYIFLAASGSATLTANKFQNQFTQVVMPHRVTKLEVDPEWLVQESSIYMKGHILREIRAVCYTSKYHQEPLQTVKNNNSQYYAVLGDIKITKSQESTKFPPSSSWLIGGQFVSWAAGPGGSKLLSVKLTWQLKDGSADIFTNYNIYVSKSSGNGNYSEVALDYVGVALLKTYYVYKLEVASGVSVLKFLVQPCGPDGACQKLQDLPFFLVQLQECGGKITIIAPENAENSEKLFVCYINGKNLNANVDYNENCVPFVDAKVESHKILQRHVEEDKGRLVKLDGTQGLIPSPYKTLLCSILWWHNLVTELSGLGSSLKGRRFGASFAS
ncbi:endo beta n-acetylglucosaminidase [Striga asiatica]|uniref:mannosyl-glycoprotein endo-beta-N-acetylglucosaminidase n=1 Tax=Striga asiatica TaxID=4170 RepID=A0A5A7QID6_STRAF|nr:endo beta n-acetylglucosaminidase [Striga asiatica]